jgi:hypothetical protein
MTPEMREINEQLKALEERVNALSPLAETAEQTEIEARDKELGEMAEEREALEARKLELEAEERAAAKLNENPAAGTEIVPENRKETKMEENKIQEVVEEIKSAKDQELQDTITKWFEQTYNKGIKIGAQYLAAAVAGVMDKHVKKGKDVSKRDLERCIRDIYKIVAVQLTQQNDLEDDNDGTAEEIS